MGIYYEINIKKKSKTGNILSLKITMDKNMFLKKKKLKNGCAEITVNTNHFNVLIERYVSVKKITKVNNYKRLHYYHDGIFSIEVEHLLTQDYFNKIHLNYLTHKNKRQQEISKIQTKKKQKKNTSTPSTTKPTTNKELKIWVARDTSYRRCGNCDFYHARQSRCGLFSKEVKANNACKRFYSPKIRIYFGGGFSPR
jgi:hypothetical protein